MGALSWTAIAAVIALVVFLVVVFGWIRERSTLTITQGSSHRAALEEIGNELISRIKLPLGTINPDIPRRGSFHSKLEYFWIRNGIHFEHLERIVITIFFPGEMKTHGEMHELSRSIIEPKIHDYLKERPGVHVRLRIFLWPAKTVPTTSTLELENSKPQPNRRN